MAGLLGNHVRLAAMGGPYDTGRCSFSGWRPAQHADSKQPARRSGTEAATVC